MASVLQITGQSRDVTNCHHLARGITRPNFDFISCLELLKELIYASPKLWKKIANLSLSQIEIGPVHRNIPCVSACICSNDALPSLVQLNQELQYYSGVDTPFFYTTNTIRTFLDNLCLTLTWWKPFIKITMQF